MGTTIPATTEDIRNSEAITHTRSQKDFLEEMYGEHNIDVGAAQQTIEFWHQWKQAQRQAQQLLKQDRKEFVDSIIRQANHANNSGLTGEFWKAINRITKHKPKQTQLLKNDEGKWCITTQQELNTFKKHLQTDFKTSDTPQIGIQHTAARLRTNSITLRAAIHKIHQNKAVAAWSAPTQAWQLAS